MQDLILFICLLFSRILHRNGFSKEERTSYKHILIDNLIMYTQIVIEAMKPLEIDFHNPLCEVGFKTYIFLIILSPFA